jgi:hypothetical protein
VTATHLLLGREEVFDHGFRIEEKLVISAKTPGIATSMIAPRLPPAPVQASPLTGSSRSHRTHSGR